MKYKVLLHDVRVDSMEVIADGLKVMRKDKNWS